VTTATSIPNQTTGVSSRAVTRLERLIAPVVDRRLVPDLRKFAVQLHEAVTGRRA